MGVGQQQVGELAGGAERPLRGAVGAVEAVRPVAVALANGQRVAALRVATEIAPVHPPQPPADLPGRIRTVVLGRRKGFIIIIFKLLNIIFQ